MKGRPLQELAAILGSKWTGSEYFMGAAADSRKVKSGDLFFALKGEKTDGHQFLGEAFEKGAVAAVISKDFPESPKRCIVVDDVLLGLQQLARLYHAEKKPRVIGITGSIGKTTTKEFIAQILSYRFRVIKTPGNANSQIGLPLAILNETEEGEIIVVEMGMTDAGQIASLVSITPPEVAYVTKIGNSHISHFEDGILGVARAKAEIFSHPQTKLGIVQQEAYEKYSVLRETGSCKKMTFHAADIVSLAFSLPFTAAHFNENVAGAVCVARYFGMTDEEIREAVKNLKPPAMRFERSVKDGIVIINDAYNASPESMRAALSNLPKAKGKRIAVFGGMTDLGDISEEHHVALAEFALDYVDHALCYGERCKVMVPIFTKGKKSAHYFDDMAELKKALFALAKGDDIVLIKGSNYNNLWRLLE